MEIRASALFLSSGELAQTSTANSKSCEYERLARRKRLMRRGGNGARVVAIGGAVNFSPARRVWGRNGWAAQARSGKSDAALYKLVSKETNYSERTWA